MTSTTSRLLAVLSLLQARRDWPGSVLAERLGISHRTVRRDVERLRALGYRIHAVMGPDGGYRLEAGSELPPLLFDDDQVLALAIALQSAGASGAGIGEAAARALTTVRQVMPSRLRHRLASLQFSVVPRPASEASAVSPDVLAAVSGACAAQEVLRFEYRNTTPAEGLASRLRRVEPHHVVTVDARWYLVAWDLDRNAWRIFRVDRITPRTPTGPRFARRSVPGGDVSAFVSARFTGSDQGGTWPVHGTVVLGLPARDVAPYVHDGTVEDLGDGRCRLSVGSWSWIALAAALGRFDTSIEVIRPPELVAAFAELAARYARAAGLDHHRTPDPVEWDQTRSNG